MTEEGKENIEPKRPITIITLIRLILGSPLTSAFPIDIGKN